MKKLLYLFSLLAMASVVVITSCKKDDEPPPPPTINLSTDAGFIFQDVTITSGDSIRFKVTATSEKLTSFTYQVSYDAAALTTLKNVSISNQPNFTWDTAFTARSVVGTEAYTFTFTDKNGTSASKTITITTQAATTPLSSETAFTWFRCGGGSGSGLLTVGLEWTSNTATSAIITPITGNKLVILTSADWTSITTKEALQTAVDNGTAATQYDGVSVVSSNTYDDVLGTKNGANYYLIHVTNGTVTTPPCGTQIEITGGYKN